MKEIKFKKIDFRAIIPEYQTEGSAGFDFHSTINAIILPGHQMLIPTGLSCEIPLGTELQIRPRSGNALKHGVTLTNSPGTLDSDYRGPIGCIVINHGKKNFCIKEGDRIAQGILANVIQAKISQVDELSDTTRGSNGYGSTGK